MSFNWSIVKSKIYGIIKGSCKTLKMYDEQGNDTIDPDAATRFFATLVSNNATLDNFTILIAIHDQGQTSYINIKTPNLKNDADFKKVYQIRNHIRTSVGLREGIKVIWQVFDREIDPREEAVHNIKESNDVGKWFGTTKSSFQRIGDAKLVVRHNEVVNEAKPGARTRHIRALFVENKHGERFSYPHLHMSGARAFARHISNGGTNHDTIAESIKSLSSDYISLRQAAHTMRQHQTITEWIVTVRENMDQINRRLKSLHGPKGYANAASILAEESIILDEAATTSMWQKIAEACECSPEDQQYNNLGVAAKYLGKSSQQPTPITFSWHRKPDISSAPVGKEVIERLQWQLSELADACSDSHASARLAEIAEMLSNQSKPSDDDISLVREAIASSMTYTEDQTMIPEEAELDSFLNEFTPEAIFTETNDDTETNTGNTVYCSSCGGEFHVSGQKHGFSHCSAHKGLKSLDEDTSYGVTQKRQERDDEIASNDKQRAARWNFGEPVADDTAADSDLEETSDIRFIPTIPGEVIAHTGNYYLVFNPDRQESRTVKNEYEVYKKTDGKYDYIENLNMPYERPDKAIAIFDKKYAITADNTSSGHPDEQPSTLARLKSLAGM